MSKYTYNVFNQDLSHHCLIACIRYGSAVKQPPLITVKHSLKHFCEQAFLINLARVSWKDIDLIMSVEDAWLFFKSNFLTILNKHAPFIKCRTKNRYSPWFTPDLTAHHQHKKTSCGVLHWHRIVPAICNFSGKSGTNTSSQSGKQRLAFSNRKLHPVALTPKRPGTLKSPWRIPPPPAAAHCTEATKQWHP